MRRITILTALWIAASLAFAQEVKTFVDDHFNAQFPGGEKACMKWIQEHIKYPEGYTSNQPQERVFVTFIVEKDGSIDSIKVFRSPDPLLSKEAIRVVSEMPKWVPERYKGKARRSRYNLPIIFRQP